MLVEAGDGGLEPENTVDGSYLDVLSAEVAMRKIVDPVRDNADSHLLASVKLRSTSARTRDRKLG